MSVIPFKCILGRNFIVNDNYTVAFVNRNVVINPVVNTYHEQVSDISDATTIMQINYVDNDEFNELNINKNLSPEIKLDIKRCFVENYMEPNRPIAPDMNYENHIKQLNENENSR